MVFWLIGISGAGKTTLGEKLKSYFDALQKKSYLIDGDLVRDFYDNDLGYTRGERMANIKRITLAAHVLNECGVIAVICNISPFEELRAFARTKIKGYNEIYLKKKIAMSLKDDPKEMYQKNMGKTEIVGMEVPFDEPLASDLVIDVDEMSVEESFDRVINYIQERYPEECR